MDERGRRKKAEDRRTDERKGDRVRMWGTVGARETKRMLEAVFPMAGKRRMGSRWRGGEKKGVKNVGAEETGGKNRAVSTEAAGVCRESGTGGKDRARGLERGVGREELGWRTVVVDGRRMQTQT